MGIDASSRWYVVHTQPLAEFRAAEHLRRQDFVPYLPRYLKKRRHARRVEKIVRPLFPRYLFVSVDVATQRWRSIHSTVGVCRLVCRGDEPAPVPPQVVEAIKAREDAEGFVTLDQRPRFAAGERVRILDGVFSACDGIFECLVDHERVAILLNVLGRQVRTVVGDEFITAA